MNMGELFAGIGGFSLGFRRAGFDVKWQVEIDPYCRKVLAKNFPEAERFNDVRECGSANLRPVDVICGGFPCQDISYAGLGAGIDGERSGLWREYARIIGELRPRFAVVENVPALLTRGLGRVLGDLASIGYDAEWEVISAADAGAPHLRERVWIVTYPQADSSRPHTHHPRPHRAPMYKHGSAQLRDKQIRELGQVGEDVAHPQREWRGELLRPRSERKPLPATVWEESALSTRSSGEDVADASEQQRDRRMYGTCGWEREPQEALRHTRGRGRQETWMSIPEPLLGRVADGVPSRVDRLRTLGNAVVPQIPEWIANRILQARAA